ncbi:MAG: penicillin-binding protein 2 [Elusimicrobia bacterium]|nr:penicillin-binding protein 2 [Elusimicrobiota bacterium]
MRSGVERRGRLEALWLVIAAGGAALGLRLAQMQILDAASYREAAERNRSQMIYQTAPRGRIYDRHGELLATSAPAFSLVFLPHRGRTGLAALAGELARQLGRDPEEILKTLQEAAREESAVTLADNLPAPVFFRLSELKALYPGVDLILEARRYYPFGRFSSHFLGYMGRMNRREWRALRSQGYRLDSRVGKLGLEKIFEGELRGRDGGLRMEVDAQGRLKRILGTLPWRPGGDLRLTLDARVQAAADEALRATGTGRGAAVAIDPRNGDLLALSSQPDFDPNALLSAAAASARVGALPEFDNAISGTYPPGSTFKPIVGLAALNERRVRPQESFYCPGSFRLGVRTFLCWEHKGHGSVSWLEGLAKSCDVYFYNAGLRAGGALIERYSRAFGLGSRVGLGGFSTERPGNLFGPQARGLAGRGWHRGDTLNLSIGQGELLVTPLQMAVVAASLANRGTVWRPRYTSRVVYADGRPDYVQGPEILGRVQADGSAWDQVQRALELAVSSGTGMGARVPGLSVAGKTGTAQNPFGEDHAWFIAYAARPGEPAAIAVAVLVENGGHGGAVAAPVARRMIEARFGRPGPFPSGGGAG